jgi:hypothetical protein
MNVSVDIEHRVLLDKIEILEKRQKIKEAFGSLPKASF